MKNQFSEISYFYFSSYREIFIENWGTKMTITRKKSKLEKSKSEKKIIYPVLINGIEIALKGILGLGVEPPGGGGEGGKFPNELGSSGGRIPLA